jgi:exodeoxyribonuclease-5
MRLIGPAGTGKTTLLQVFIDMVDATEVILLAPTGKAALVLRQKTGLATETVHSALFGRSKMVNGELVFLDVQSLGNPGSIIIIDEASMIGRYLYRTIMKYLKYGARILFVGDKAQLPPVNDETGPNLSKPTAELTEIIRQKGDSGIITLATAVRQGNPIRALFNGKDTILTDVDPAAWYLSNPNPDKIVLCHSNADRNRIINDIRSASNRRKWLEVGETIVCKRNNKYVDAVNGEFFTVTEVKPLELNLRILVDQVPIDIDGWYQVCTAENPSIPFVLNARYPMLSIPHPTKKDVTVSFSEFIQAKLANRKRFTSEAIFYATMVAWQFACCITVYTAQGSEFKDVYFYQRGSQLLELKQGNPGTRALYYTAFTRARERLFVNHCIPGQP